MTFGLRWCSNWLVSRLKAWGECAKSSRGPNGPVLDDASTAGGLLLVPLWHHPWGRGGGDRRGPAYSLPNPPTAIPVQLLFTFSSCLHRRPPQTAHVRASPVWRNKTWDLLSSTDRRQITQTAARHTGLVFIGTGLCSRSFFHARVGGARSCRFVYKCQARHMFSPWNVRLV